MAAKRVAEQHGTDDLILLFADTKTEDEDLYRFIHEAAENIGGELVIVADGRDVWQVFFDSRFLGNSRVDPCSRILKRELLDNWIKERFAPPNVTCYIGIDWSEEHRFTRLRERKMPYVWKAPLCDPPYINKIQMLEALKAEGIEPPRLYSLGFPHNNCGGFCIKAGQSQFKKLLQEFPERYAYHEGKEQEIRAYLGRDDISILRRMVKGVRHNLTLKELREELQTGQKIDEFDWGGCGCFIDEPEEIAP
jgi:hypothetical protein